VGSTIFVKLKHSVVAFHTVQGVSLVTLKSILQMTSIILLYIHITILQTELLLIQQKSNVKVHK
jgi:hypothetical protein